MKQPRHSSKTFLLSIIIAGLLGGCAGPGSSRAHRKTAIHTAYAYAFLSQRADRIADENYHKARKLRRKALKHYTKAYESGLSNLDIRHPGFIAQLAKSPRAAASMTTTGDVRLLYWTAASLGAAIGLSKDRTAMLIRLPQVGALAFRVTELEPGYAQGAAFQLMMIYEAGRPAMMGGSLALARHYYAEALSYSDGGSPSLFAAYAESICIQEQDREAFVEWCEKALATPNKSAADRYAKKRARWLLERIDDLFI